MDGTQLDILYEDNHCLAVNKAAGVGSAHFQGKDETLDRLVKQYLKTKYGKPGNVFLGVVQRLDKPVSGVLLFARTSKAAARLAEQFRTGSVAKVYWAIVEGTPANEGELEDWLRKEPATGSAAIVAADTPAAKRAVLRYQRRGGYGGLSWLEVRPMTGRTHQLRIQLSHHGHPIFGDVRYGSRHHFGGGIALHARSLTFVHPVRQEPTTLTADPPPSWRRFQRILAEVRP